VSEGDADDDVYIWQQTESVDDRTGMLTDREGPGWGASERSVDDELTGRLK